VHHTSFLWSFREENMRHLTLPPNRPAYRHDRSHGAILTPLCKHHPLGEALDDEGGAEALHDAIEALKKLGHRNVEFCFLPLPHTSETRAPSSDDIGKIS
jgi:hypothetical protein